MLKGVSKESNVTLAMPNHNKCIVHYLDISNIDLTIEYLKTAWQTGSIDQRHLYCVTSTYQNLANLLKYTDIADFQRLIISVPTSVSYNNLNEYIC